MIKNLSNKQRICAKIAIVLIVISLLFSYITTISYCADTYNRFDDANVLDDLNSATIGGDRFNISDYGFDKNKKPEIINFVEYCYSYYKKMQSNYALYIYVYNPQGLNIEAYHTSNKIQMAVSWDADGAPNEYDKFALRYCNKSETAGYEKRFYKFRVVDKVGADGKTMLERLNAKERRYDVSGFEIAATGDSNAKDYTVGGTYKFSGHVAGYGADPNAQSDLKSSVNDLETVRLKPQSAYYRSGANSENQEQINSVYFGVPSATMAKYGKLQKVKTYWDEYKANTIVINDPSYFNIFAGLVGKNANPNVANVSPSMYVAALGAGPPNYKWSWNARSSSVVAGTKANVLPAIFRRNEADIANAKVSGQELIEYLKNYKASAVKGYLPISSKDGAKYSADMFLDTVDPGRGNIISKPDDKEIIRDGKPGPITSIFDTDNRFDFLNYTDDPDNPRGFWKIFGVKQIVDVGNFSPIQEITMADIFGSDADVAKRLLIDISEVPALRKYLLDYPFERTHILRYATTNYYSTPLTMWNGDSHSLETRKKAYYAEGTTFLNFDIIELTFNKDGVYKVIPVVSDPLDIAFASTAPPGMGGEKGSLDWLWLILAIIALILLMPIIAPIIGAAIKLVVWIIPLPFKAIGAIFRGGKSKKTPSEPSGGAKYTTNNFTVSNSKQAKAIARKRFKKE